MPELPDVEVFVAISLELPTIGAWWVLRRRAKGVLRGKAWVACTMPLSRT
jgi:hypothetical protein